MRFSLFTALLASSAIAFEFPLGNNFPKPSNKQLATIEKHAGGSIPPGALPTKLSTEATAAFQLIALNEIFEVAYFTQLLKKIKAQEPGFKVGHYDQRVFRRIRAQEELHAIGANAILEAAGEKTVGGCKYMFPAKNFDEALELAETFTALVLGTIPIAQDLFATDANDEVGLIPLLGAILAQEGEQTGWFRASLKKAPSAAPFLTGGAIQLTYSALRLFIEPGSCPVYPDIPYFTPITLVTPPMGAKNQMLTFSVEADDIDASKMSMAYISGQQPPAVVPISSVKKMGKMMEFKAEFPFNTGFAKGLSLGALVSSSKKPTTAAEVGDYAAYGPALILLQ